MQNIYCWNGSSVDTYQPNPIASLMCDEQQREDVQALAFRFNGFEYEAKKCVLSLTQVPNAKYTTMITKPVGKASLLY